MTNITGVRGIIFFPLLNFKHSFSLCLCPFCPISKLTHSPSFFVSKHILDTLHHILYRSALRIANSASHNSQCTRSPFEPTQFLQTRPLRCHIPRKRPCCIGTIRTCSTSTCSKRLVHATEHFQVALELVETPRVT